MLHAGSKHSDWHPGIIASTLRRNAPLMIVQRFGQIGRSKTMWRQPPRLSRKACPVKSRTGESKGPRQQVLILLLTLTLLLISAPVHAHPWTLHSQPTRLLNGAPVLFQVKPSEKL